MTTISNFQSNKNQIIKLIIDSFILIGLLVILYIIFFSKNIMLTSTNYFNQYAVLLLIFIVIIINYSIFGIYLSKSPFYLEKGVALLTFPFEVFLIAFIIAYKIKNNR